MEKIVLCPECKGKTRVRELNEEKFDRERIVGWIDKPCPVCKGKGFILINTEELVKL